MFQIAASNGGANNNQRPEGEHQINRRVTHAAQFSSGRPLAETRVRMSRAESVWGEAR